MGWMRFAIKMLIKDVKQSIFYVFSMIFATTVIFNIFNLLYNPDFVTDQKNYMIFSGITTIILLVAMFLVAFANLYFIYGKTKELAIAVLSGRSVYTVGSILTIQNLILGLIGTGVGLAVGGAIMPIVNSIVYKSSGMAVDKFAFSSTGFIITVLLIVIEFVFMILFDMGYVYRREVIELVKEKENITEYSTSKKIKYENQFKFELSRVGEKPKKEIDPRKKEIRQNRIYIILYLLPILSILLPINVDEKSIIVNLLIFVSLIGMVKILVDLLPKYINKIKQDKYLYKEIQLQSLSNLLYALRKTKYLVVTTVVAVVILLNVITDKDGFPHVKVITIIAYIIVNTLMALATNYKIFIEGSNRKRSFKQLVLIGYTSDKIKKIIAEEVLFFYGIIVLIPAPHIIVVLVLNILCGQMSVMLALLLAGMYFGIFIISCLVSLIGYKKIIFKYLVEV